MAQLSNGSWMTALAWSGPVWRRSVIPEFDPFLLSKCKIYFNSTGMLSISIRILRIA